MPVAMAEWSDSERESWGGQAEAHEGAAKSACVNYLNPA